jgi:hypothetical protein
MVEVHIIGEVKKAINFREPRLFCSWEFKTGPLWRVVEGQEKGQTSVNSSRFEENSIFCDPIDLHYATRGIQGWPKLSIEVFSVNSMNQFYPVSNSLVKIDIKYDFNSVLIRLDLDLFLYQQNLVFIILLFQLGKYHHQLSLTL